MKATPDRAAAQLLERMEDDHLWQWREALQERWLTHMAQIMAGELDPGSSKENVRQLLGQIELHVEHITQELKQRRLQEIAGAASASLAARTIQESREPARDATSTAPAFQAHDE